MSNKHTRGPWSIFNSQPVSLEHLSLCGKLGLEMLEKMWLLILLWSLCFSIWVPGEVVREVVLSCSPHSRVSICRNSVIPGEIKWLN